MATNKEKHINQIVGNMMKASSLEKPSPDFSSSVLSKIEALETSKLKYQPVISQRVWFAIVVFSIAFLIGIVLLTPQSQTSYLDSFSHLFHFHMNWNFLPLLSLEFSNILIYAILIFALMFAVQISFMKHFFKKHL